MNRILFTLLAGVFTLQVMAQENLPTDYLTKEFHKGRRDAFREMMPSNSVAFVFSYPERVFSNDVNYVFHQNPDLYYLTGYKEPDAVLVLFKEKQGAGDSSYNEVFFVRKRDPMMEQWTGRRLGVEGVKKQLGFTQVYEGKEFSSFPIDVSKFSQVITDQLPEGTTGEKNGSDLGSMVDLLQKDLSSKPGDTATHLFLQNIANTYTAARLPNLKRYIERVKNERPAL